MCECDGFASLAGDDVQSDDEVQTSEAAFDLERQAATENGIAMNSMIAASIIVFKYYADTFQCDDQMHGLLHHMMKE